MPVAGNICNYIQLRKGSPGLEEISGMWERAALWVEERWELRFLVGLSAGSFSLCLSCHQSSGMAVLYPLILQ